MFERLSSFIKKSLLQPAWFTNRYNGELSGNGHTATGQIVTPETALSSSAVVACTRLLSETVAALPLHVLRDDGRSKTVETSHAIYDLLHYNPNEFQTSFTFFQWAIVQMLLRGNAYSFIERDGNGTPIALWPLRTEAVTVEVANGTISYRYQFGANREVYGFRDVLHFKALSLDGITGMSVIHMAREGIGLSLAQERHGASLFKNNARPGLIMQHPGTLSDEAYKRLRSSLDDGYTGTANGFRTMILEDGMTVEPYGFTAEDSQFLESRQFSVIEIARFFRVPPTMIGDMTRVSYSSSESEMQLFAMHSLAPLCANLEAEMNLKLFPTRTQFQAKFDVNSIVRGDQSARYAAYSQGLVAGFLTVADVRSAEDLPFIAGTDILNRPANMLPHQQPTEVRIGTVNPGP